MIRDWLRFTVWLPATVLSLIADRLTRDRLDKVIAEYNQRRRAMAEGQ